MGKYHTQEQINAWREKAGYKTTSSVIKAEAAAREAEGESAPAARQVTGDELEQLLGRMGGSSTSGDPQQQMIELLRDINNKLDNMGRIG